MLENKLGITNSVELSKEEEKITKLKALKLFDTNKIEEYEIGTFKGLSDIHKFLFDDIYFFAGKIRKENIAKGNFRFASCMYLEDVLNKIDKMPQHTFEEIVQKYIEMNIAHPFRDENEPLGQQKTYLQKYLQNKGFTDFGKSFLKKKFYNFSIKLMIFLKYTI